MKLSEEQIQELYNFTRRRLVEHYDLQTELVDHLANGIEQQWEENKEIPFKEALKNEFKKFGNFGFRGVLKARKKTMNKKYNRLILNEFKTYFLWPRIAMVLTLTIALFGFLQVLPSSYKWVIMAMITMPIAAYFMFRSYKVQKTYRSKIGIEKRWMLQEKIYNIGGAGASMLNLFQVFNMMYVLKLDPTSFLLDVLVSGLIVVSITLCYVIAFVLPERVEQILSKEYPEYQLISKKWR